MAGRELTNVAAGFSLRSVHEFERQRNRKKSCLTQRHEVTKGKRFNSKLFFFVRFACTRRLRVVTRVQGVATCEKLVFYELIKIERVENNQLYLPGPAYHFPPIDSSFTRSDGLPILPEKRRSLPAASTCIIRSRMFPAIVISRTG